MAKIIIDIKTCRECPFFKITKVSSTDGWDRGEEDWHCNKKDKKIAGFVEWHEEDKIEVPEWCPYLLKENTK